MRKNRRVIPITDTVVVPVAGETWRDAKRFFEKCFVSRLLLKNKGNMAACSRDADIDRKNFYEMIERCGITLKNVGVYRRKK